MEPAADPRHSPATKAERVPGWQHPPAKPHGAAHAALLKGGTGKFKTTTNQTRQESEFQHGYVCAPATHR